MDIVDLKNRLRAVEIETAKLEERKATAEAKMADAKARLKALGIKPAQAPAIMEEKYMMCVDKLEELEELLGI